MPRIVVPPVRSAVADCLVHDIPAIDHSGKLFLKVADHLVNIAGQPFPVHFRIGKRFLFIVIFMEEPGILHHGIPDQHMAADGLPVLLAPGKHLVRIRIVHPGHPVFTAFAGILIQQRIGLRFICARQGVKVIVQKIHIGFVTHIKKAETPAQPETVGLRKGIQRLIFIGRFPGEFLKSRFSFSGCGCKHHRAHKAEG